MNNKTLIYIGKVGPAVFDSQVVELLVEIEKKNFFNKVILLAGINKNNNHLIEPLIKKSGLKIIPFKQFPNYHFFRGKQKKELKKVLSNFLGDNTIIHTRGESLFQVLRPIINDSNTSILGDIRGAVYEETLLYDKLKPVFQQLKLYQHKNNLRNLKNNIDYVSCVSNKMKAYIIDRTSMEHDKIYVNHCISGENFKFSESIRKEYRKKLNIDDQEVLFLFSTGGDSNWQNTEEIVNRISKKGFKILNLSKRNIDNENVINLFVPYHEVSRYLNAVDVAIIWRKNDIVNDVASPVKFSEYVSSGLPVIANDGVDLISSYIEKTKHGKIIENFNEINATIVEELKSVDRIEISLTAQKIFSANTIVDQYLSLYQNMYKTNH